MKQSIQSLCRNRWLSMQEIENLLVGNAWQAYGFSLSMEPPTNVADGQIFFFDRSLVPKFKQDGVQYALKKNKDRVQETYHNFKVNGVERINAVYCRGRDNKNFSRRIYRLLGDGESNIVFVHYRDTPVDDSMTATVNVSQIHNKHDQVNSIDDTTNENPFFKNVFKDEFLDSAPISNVAYQDFENDHWSDLDDCGSIDEMLGTVPFNDQNDLRVYNQFNEDIRAEGHSICMRKSEGIELNTHRIVDFAPSSGSSEGGLKVLIVLDKSIDADSQIKVLFGDTETPAEIISSCALRCFTPATTQLGHRCSLQVLTTKGALTPESCLLFEYIPTPNSTGHFGSSHLDITDSASLNDPVTYASPSESMLVEEWQPATNNDSDSVIILTEHLSDKIDNSLIETYSDRENKRRVIEMIDKVLIQPITSSNPQLPSALHSHSLLKLPGRSDPPTIMWLSDKELDQMPPGDLGRIMDNYVTEVITQLVQYTAMDDDLKAELDTLDSSGFSLLHYCCMYNLLDLVPILLGRNVDVNISALSGKTALHMAVEGGNIQMMDLLVSAGADFTLQDNEGVTAKELGLLSAIPEVVSYCSTQMIAHKNPVNHSNQHGKPSLKMPDTIKELGSYRKASPDIPSSPLDRSTRSNVEISEASTKLLYAAFASFSLADKCALSLSFSGQADTPQGALSPLTGSSTPHHEPKNVSSFNERKIDISGDKNPAAATQSTHLSRTSSVDIDIDIQSVISESDKESLDVAMSMMGQDERQQVENEVRIIQSNVRAWLLRKNYVSLRDSAKILQGFWRDKKKSMTSTQNNSSRKRGLSGKVKSIQQQKRDGYSTAILSGPHSSVDEKEDVMDGNNRERVESVSAVGTASYERQVQAAETLQAATRGMIARKSFARIRRQAMASLVIQRSFLMWWNRKTNESP